VTNRERKLLRQAQSRHGRKRSGLVLCEGVRCCMEALSRRHDWLQFAVFSQSFAKSPDAARVAGLCEGSALSPSVVPDAEFTCLAETENPQGVLCVLRRADPGAAVESSAQPFALVVDRVQEPGNMGTILRAAWAVGLQDVWLTEGATDPFGPKAIRAGMGAQFALNVRVVPDLSAAKEVLTGLGVGVFWRSVPAGGISCYEPTFELAGNALIVGNESTGAASLAGAQDVTIPMPGGAESLNAAQAATVLMCEAVRRSLATGAPR